jgi:pimeloyl-ACP methyl ester carboxylesterase
MSVNDHPRPRQARAAGRPCRRGAILSAHLLAAIFLAASTIGCSADSLVLGENHASIDLGGAQRRVVSAGGRSVECWVVRSPGAAAGQPRAFVLMLEGKGGRAEEWVGQVAESWGRRPVEVWGMNYPGFGGSAGSARMADVVPAALAVFDSLRQAAGDRPVFIQAASFGTAPALAVAARRPVAGLLLWNAPPLRELIVGNYGWWNLWLAAEPVAARVPAELDSLANASRSIAPAVFVVAGADEIIPPAYQRRVVDAYIGPKRLIEVPGARHADPLTREAAAQLADGMDWLLSCDTGFQPVREALEVRNRRLPKL